MKVLQQLMLAAVLVLSLHAARAQRGCPSEGCDSRGLNCQADFKVDSSNAAILWEADLGSINGENVKTLGCVGNSANVVCRVANTDSKGFVSIEALTGRVKWYDTLMDNPRMPIMNLQGDIIATDGQHMEMRLYNGSLVGKPTPFLGYINDTSSIHYVEDPNLFFFVSYHSGGMYMYDTSGMCVASNFLNEKDPITNQTVSVWVPVTRLIVNTEIDPPCTYFIAQNNATNEYRVYAVNFNHQPPYLLEKWHLDLHTGSSNKITVAGSRLIVRGSVIIISGGGSMAGTLVISDESNRGVIKHSLDVNLGTLASFDFPAGSQRPSDQSDPIIWLNTLELDKHDQAVIRGWDSYNTGSNITFKYSINLSELYGIEYTAITSELMVFGYHPEDTALVFAYTGSKGSHIVAIKPMPDGTVHTLWDIALGTDLSVYGQIIGINDSMLLANAVLGDGSIKLLGIKIGG